MGMTMCVIGTGLMVWGNVALFTREDIDFGMKDKDNWLIIPYILTMLAIWWSLPLAWAKGLLFDPIIVILGVMSWIPFMITGVFRSEDAAERMRRERNGGCNDE